MDFYSELNKLVLASYSHHYSLEDNFDFIRFGNPGLQPLRINDRLIALLRRIMAKKGYSIIHETDQSMANLGALDGYYPRLADLYQMLADDQSRQILLQVLAYRLLGYTKVKLPMNNSTMKAELKELEKLTDYSDPLSVRFPPMDLGLVDLHKKGMPVKFYFSPMGAYVDFIFRQYEYRSRSMTIKASKGDYVIDAGGCWGDTALYFANEVGEEGKVFTYEFIPSNLEILSKNLALNPALKERISVLKQPVWENSEQVMYYTDNGPGSNVFLEERPKYDGKVKSLSIDDLVEANKLDRIDFIKMDIEGAEPYALRGAVETMRKFKPKLAIAIYHSLEDFVKIPEFISGLGLGYRFYLSHCSIHEEETILFAEIPAP